jgi:tetratricopeptide (TPR) repeat protein
MIARWLLGAARRRMVRARWIKATEAAGTGKPGSGEAQTFPQIFNNPQDLERLSEAELLDVLSEPMSPIKRMRLARHLSKRGFSELADRILRMSPLKDYPQNLWPEVGNFLSKSGSAPDADQLLQIYWPQIEPEKLDRKEFRSLGEWIIRCGLSVPNKVEMHSRLQRAIPEGMEGSPKWKLKRLKLSNDDLQHLSLAEFETLAKLELNSRERLFVASFLQRLGYEKLARDVLCALPISDYPNEFLPRIGVIITGTSVAADIDSRLSGFIANLDPKSTPARTAKSTLTWLRRSALDSQTRLDLLSKLWNITPIDQATPGEWQAALRIAEYEHRRDENQLVDPLDFIPAEPMDPQTASLYTYFISHLRMNGHTDQSLALISALRAADTKGGVHYWIHMLRNFPHMVDPGQLSIPNSLRERVELLTAISPVAELDRKLGELLEQLQFALVADFAKATLLEQNSILKAFLHQNLFDIARRAVAEADRVSELLLPAKTLEAWTHFDEENYAQAHKLFAAVLDQKPADMLAMAGFRLTSVRTTAGFDAIIEYSDAIEGRRISKKKIFKDFIWERRARGEMAQAAMAHLYDRQWALLSNLLGDRFLINQSLENLNPASRVFIIASAGVGDEIRIAKLYPLLTSKFRDITATCDPRLIGLFSRSFPHIKLVPCWRNRPGLIDRLDKMEGRITGYNGTLYQILSEEAGAHLSKADYVLSIGYLRFLDAIGALGDHEPRTGYLVPPSGARVAQRPAKARNRPYRVGLLWRSHLLIKERRHLYLPIEAFVPLLDVPGVEFHAIQHELTLDERAFCIAHGIVVRDDIDFFNDFEAMSDYLATLDLAMGISSVPNELAAAVGVPVWFLGFSPENYYLRTNGGKTEIDQLTQNAHVITAPDIDFTEPACVCIERTMSEVRRRLETQVTRISCRLRETE